MLRVFAAAAAAGPALRSGSTRPLAIPATVKTAPDTSEQNFPAPSHASLAGDAADIARQMTAFFKNPDSTVTLSAEDRAELLDGIIKRGQAAPETQITAEWVKSKYSIPEKLRLGDNPMFKAYNPGQ
jgi:hypothetical protein